MKEITPEQALAASYTPFRFERIKTDKYGNAQKGEDGNSIYEIAEAERFIKPGETQASAIKRLRNHALGRTKFRADSRRFPSFVPGKTTSAEYVRIFESINWLIGTSSAAHLKQPASVFSDDAPLLNTYADDLV